MFYPPLEKAADEPIVFLYKKLCTASELQHTNFLLCVRAPQVKANVEAHVISNSVTAQAL